MLPHGHGGGEILHVSSSSGADDDILTGAYLELAGRAAAVKSEDEEVDKEASSEPLGLLPICDSIVTHDEASGKPRVLWLGNSNSNQNKAPSKVKPSTSFAIQQLQVVSEPPLVQEETAGTFFLQFASTTDYLPRKQEKHDEDEEEEDSDSAYPKNPRHVDWEETLSEEEDEDEDMPSSRPSRQQHQSQQDPFPPVLWNQQQQQQQQPFPGTTRAQQENSLLNTATTLPNDEDTVDKAFIEEQVRRQLERCDALQGCILVANNRQQEKRATTFLHALRDASPKVPSWLWWIQSAASASSSTNSRWLDQVQTGCAWSESLELVRAILPLEQELFLYSATKSTTALLTAAALETATLPLRLSFSSPTNSRMAYWNRYDGNTDPLALLSHRSSMSNFLYSLQGSRASPQWASVLELDVVLPAQLEQEAARNSGHTTCVTDCLWKRIQEGTTTVAPAPTRGRQSRDNVLLGEWMQSARGSGENPSSGGLLTCLSPLGTASTANADNTSSSNNHDDRSLHLHFGLSTSIRSRRPTTDNVLPGGGDPYLSALVQGMRRYHPDSCWATVVNQDLAQLTERMKPQEWRSVYESYSLGPTAGDPSPAFAATSLPRSFSWPMVSVLGHTTRRYRPLHDIAHNLDQAVNSATNRGMYDRNVMAGLVPERDDVLEAVERCWNVRDCYQPPAGSGLVVNAEGTYFDGNEES